MYYFAFHFNLLPPSSFVVFSLSSLGRASTVPIDIFHTFGYRSHYPFFICLSRPVLSCLPSRLFYTFIRGLRLLPRRGVETLAFMCIWPVPPPYLLIPLQL